MYTGIVQNTGKVTQVIEKENFRTHIVYFPTELTKDLMLGASVAHNGCCLTVTKIEDNNVSFDITAETLKLTNLGELNIGSIVNLERSAKFGDEIGGHPMSGHVFCTAEVDEVIETENNKTIWFVMPKTVERYVFHKGFVGLNGASLTVGDVGNNRFNVHLIPETRQRTNIDALKKGDKVNIEIDNQTQIMVDTIERVLSAYQEKNKIN